MNLNYFRTIMGGLTGAGVVVLLAKLVGCEVDDPATVAIEATTCANSGLLASISPFAAAIGTAVFLAIGAISKLFKGGTIKENLTAPSVPVVAQEDNREGVVTEKDVAKTKVGSFRN